METPASKSVDLYPAYKANIHERRTTAIVCRAIPVALVVLVLGLCAYGVFFKHDVLLVTCAVLNTWLWIYLVSAAICTIIGTRTSWRKMQEYDDRRLRAEENAPSPSSASNDAEVAFEDDNTGGVEEVVHLIVLPNYKEDADMLTQTLDSLSEAEGSRAFRVVLAMEAREQGAESKASRLVAAYGSTFQWITFSSHPKGLTETHNDGSWDDEIPGKASNLKWAVNHGYKECRKEGLTNLDRIILTVADADCIFHPAYFSSVSTDFTSKEFNIMRSNPGSKHMYTMWQAPQLAFRNYWISPAPSRSWGYVAGVDEYGSVAGLDAGGHAMVFSSYSVTLRLAVEACPWDGDVLAEDHHCYLRCMYYGIHAATVDTLECDRPPEETVFWGLKPPLQLRPVYLPVKATSVASDEGIVQGWLDRWQQARRHMQGVCEFAYSMLATWDLLCTLPTRVIGVHLIMKLLRANLKLFCMHMLPVLQTLALGILSLDWLVHSKKVPGCPETIRLVHSRSEEVLCGLAGAWVLVWPMFVPLCLFALTNYYYLVVTFVRPKEQPGRQTTWHREDGKVPPLVFDSVRLTLFLMVMFDVLVTTVAISVPYSLIPMLMAYWHMCIKGNRIAYVTAAKGLTGGATSDYGSMKEKKKASAV